MLTDILRQAVKGAMAVGAAGGMVGAGVAMAQNAPTASTAGQPTKLSKIIVTGSHIPQTSIATSQPVLTITRAEINASGFTTVGQILQNLPQSGASFNSQDDFFIGPYSSGFQGFNQKDLGGNRTLILVNGHRWAPTLSGSVDLSSIPAAVVQRVDVLLDGASAIYGSDAIAGVVNIITIKNYNGAKVTASLGGYDANGVGGGWDGKRQDYSFVVGSSGNRGGVLLSAGYQQSQAIEASNRSISKEPLFGFGKKFYSSFTPGATMNVFGPDLNNHPTCFVSSPHDTAPTHGCNGPVPGEQRFNPLVNGANATHDLTIPSESWYGYAQGHYDLTDNVTFTSTMMYRDRNSTQLISPTPLGLGATGLWFANGLPIGVSASNPYNPFGTDLIPSTSANSPTAGAWCSLYGTGSTPGTCKSNSDLLISYRMEPHALGRRKTVFDSQTWLFRGGFNGYFQAFGNEWNWDVSYGFTRNTELDQESGIQNTLKMQNALGPNCTGNCVPLNLFGGQSGITPAMKNYVNTTINNEAGVTQRDYSADVAGNFFNSWYAGPWGVAAGYEYLSQNGSYVPDQFVQTGNVTSNSFGATGGKIATNAQYAELKVPLASNVFLAKNISVDLANRWSQFRTSGITGAGRDHASTGRVGLKWQPIQSLLFRATWSQSFREPSVSELFSGQSTSYNNVVDPCINPTGNPPAGTYNCPNPSPTQGYGQVPTTYGGNANLTPEQATSRQVGFVWSPTFAEGLNIDADYYKVQINNAVGRLPEQTIINGCYLQDITSYCSLITRMAGRMSRVIDTNINTGSLQTNGWDVGLNYKLPTTPVGDFSIRYTANFIKSFVRCNIVTTATGLGSSCQNLAGNAYSYIPKDRMNFGLNWDYGPWAAAWNVTMIGQMWESCANSAADSPPRGTPNGPWCSNPEKYVNGVQSGQNHIGTTIYHDLQGSYTLGAWNTTFTVGINNVFNKQPPVAMTAFINNYFWYYYRIPGRYVYARVEVNF